MSINAGAAAVHAEHLRRRSRGTLGGSGRRSSGRGGVVLSMRQMRQPFMSTAQSCDGGQ
jgi:hypothetical protein